MRIDAPGAVSPQGHSAYNCTMDVYDFDKTLYRRDSTADFFKHCLRRYPRIATTLPRTAIAFGACFGVHAIDKTAFKGSLYRFLRKVPDVPREVRLFWAEHEQDIAGPCKPQTGDLVISASPEFLLKEICAKRGLKLIASHVDPHTGRVLGPNCSGEEKVRRLHQEYPDASIDRFYSDSINDTPLALLAREAWQVKGDELIAWPFGR